MKLIERHQFGGILNSLKQLLKPKYSIDEVPTGPTPPVKGWTKLPILEPDVPVDTKTYNGGTLPGVTVSAINLSKPQPFPYGGINVVSKSVNGGLDKKQRVFVNPFDKSYLASNYKEGGLIRKHQFGGSNKSNRFISSGINNIPEINVNGIDRRWRLSKRGQNHGNGHGVTSEYFYDYYNGGNQYLGDNAVIKGGRTIYSSPKGNDTLYWNNPSEWLWYQHGLMPVGANQSGAKQNFFKNLKRPLIKEQEGGHIERVDNTRVYNIPNNGEAIYEKTPVGYGDFLPLIGTYRAAQRIDKGEPNASYGDLIMNGAMDLLGARMIGSVAKAAGRLNKVKGVLKNRGYQQFTEDGSQWFRLPQKIMRGYGDKLYTYEIPSLYGSSFKTIPTVDYTPAVMAPLVQTLRAPATAPFK